MSYLKEILGQKALYDVTWAIIENWINGKRILNGRKEDRGDWEGES